MRILLTGATGFLGSYLLRRFLGEGFKVSILKRSFSSIDRIRSVLDHKNVSIHDIDVCEIEDVFRKNNFNIIIHTATEYGRNDVSIFKVLEANIVFPVKLMELGVKYGVKSFLNTDSYFNKGSYEYSSLLNYSLSKRSLLLWLEKLSPKIQIINVILEHVYGPNDSESKFVEMLFRKISVNKVKKVSLTHGHQRRDFVYVEDVVDAYLALIKYSCSHKSSYQSFEVGSGQSIEIRELAKKIKLFSNSNTVLGFGDIPYRFDENMQSFADIKQMTELGWKPQVSIDQGVKKILKKYEFEA